MKKIFIVTAMLLVAASSAFASDSITINLATAGMQGLTLYGAKSAAVASSPLIGKSSTGVGVGIKVDILGTGYALLTQHKNGTKEFGSSYDSTSVFSAPVPTTSIGTPVLAVPTAFTSVDFTSGTWTSM